MIKLVIFFLCLPFTSIGFKSLNLNNFFLKNRETEAKIFTIMLIAIFNNLFSEVIFWIYLLTSK